MTDQGSAPSSTSESTSTESPAAPLPGVYRVDPDQTVIRFRARSMFGLVPVSGTFTVGQGEFTVAEDVAASTIDVTVLAESFASGNAKRDEHIRSADYLEAAAHHDIVFRSASIQQGSATTAPGELTVRGVTQPCVLTIATVTGDDKTVTAKASTTVDRYAFGLTKQKGMVGRQTSLEIDVVAVRESGSATSVVSSEAPAEAAEEVAVPPAEAEAPVEAPAEAPAEPVTEAPVEPVAEASTEAPAEEATEEASEEPAEAVTAETAAEAAPEASTEAPERPAD
ncbi:YceI family protein [Streptacidiphilus sp. N1-10]|uniref:YceI family protein n=1 Tax=Streptacidiphilus jeojiensis TaxID=3229225 RepID=A0ABV6XVC6_9ACTN